VCCLRIAIAVVGQRGYRIPSVGRGVFQAIGVVGGADCIPHGILVPGEMVMRIIGKMRSVGQRVARIGKTVLGVIGVIDRVTQGIGNAREIVVAVVGVICNVCPWIGDLDGVILAVELLRDLVPDGVFLGKFSSPFIIIVDTVLVKPKLLESLDHTFYRISGLQR
jgi:hypothetical protein